MAHTNRANKEPGSECYTCGRFIPAIECVIRDDEDHVYCTETCRRTWAAHEHLSRVMEIGYALGAGKEVPNVTRVRS